MAAGQGAAGGMGGAVGGSAGMGGSGGMVGPGCDPYALGLCGANRKCSVVELHQRCHRLHRHHFTAGLVALRRRRRMRGGDLLLSSLRHVQAALPERDRLSNRRTGGEPHLQRGLARSGRSRDPRHSALRRELQPGEHRPVSDAGRDVQPHLGCAERGRIRLRGLGIHFTRRPMHGESRPTTCAPIASPATAVLGAQSRTKALAIDGASRWERRAIARSGVTCTNVGQTIYGYCP